MNRGREGIYGSSDERYAFSRLDMEEVDMKYEYDVAISFAREDRGYVLELVNQLTAKGINVFYSEWKTSRLWGENLYTYLEKIYRDRAMFCVTVLSHAYKEKIWTSHELKIIQERQMKGDVYWLPLFIEEVEIPGLLDTVGYVSAKDLSIEEIVELICKKVEDEKIELLEDSSNTITIVDEDGNDTIAELIVAFAFKDTHKEYMVYTYGERDRHDNETIYVSEIISDGDESRLRDIDNQHEWERIKKVLRELGRSEDFLDVSDDENDNHE